MTYWKAGLHVLHYFKSTWNYCITYRRSSITMWVFSYTDADYGSDPNDRISYTGYIFMWNGGPISSNSHKQSTVAHSTMERNIWHYQMHLEKHLQGNNSAKNSKFTHPHRQLPSFQTINLLSILPKIQRIIAKLNTSTFVIMPSITTFETIWSQLTMCQQMYKLLIYAPKYLGLSNITSAWNCWDWGTHMSNNKRRFLVSMWLSRESHITNLLVSIKDFAYLNVKKHSTVSKTKPQKC